MDEEFVMPDFSGYDLSLDNLTPDEEDALTQIAVIASRWYVTEGEKIFKQSKELSYSIKEKIYDLNLELKSLGIVVFECLEDDRQYLEICMKRQRAG